MAIATVAIRPQATVKTFDALTADQIETKLQLAASMFRKHRRTTFRTRAGKMMRAAEILEKEKDECAHLMTFEMGKPLKAAVAEAVKCATGCRYYAENAERFLADEVVETGAKTQLHSISAARADPGHHAVEFSFLAGVPLCRAGIDGGQCGTAETCLECAAVRAEDRRYFSSCGV